MGKLKRVRLGILGLGNMGSYHGKTLLSGAIRNCELTAVCDAAGRFPSQFDGLKTFTESEALIRSGLVDAVLVATPHYHHVPIGVDALANGLHVLVEKPVAVHKLDALKLLKARKDEKLVFAAMFNQRTDPRFRKIKQLIDRKEVGTLRRFSWIVTDWFRPQAYYASGSWRATWQGEGGGVLLNQCPHNLDMLQWLCGMPSAVRGFCRLGARHDIEVEDEVTAYLEWDGGATGVFITSTGEAPGTNRLEIAGDRGRLTLEEGTLRFLRNEEDAGEFLRAAKGPFDKPGIWDIGIPTEGEGGQHAEVLQNFVDAILEGKPLIAPGGEGIRSVELANAILYSSLEGKTVPLPLDAEAYARRLAGLIEDSRFEKKVVAQVAADMSKSF